MGFRSVYPLSAPAQVPRQALLAVLMLALGGSAARGEEPLAGLEQLEQVVQRVVEQVSPSVVGIRVQRRYLAPGDAGADARLPLREELVTVNGSGTVVDADGLILTNEHVVQGAVTIEVQFSDGSTCPASIRGSDARSDLAILEVPRRGLTPARLGDAGNLARGQWTIALGNPYGLGSDGKACVSVGVISNLGRRLPGLGAADDRLYNDMIQTTAAIHPGNSGGPLFNIRGELIGVVTAMHTRAVLDEGVGFAIPLNERKRQIILRLVRGQAIEYGYAGMTVRDLTDDERRGAGPAAGGALVEDVEVGGPAQRAGVRGRDVVTAVEGRPVRDAAHLVEIIGTHPPGHVLELSLLRNGRSEKLRLTLERRDPGRVGWMRGHAVLWRGLRLADLTPEARQRMNLDAQRGIVVIDVLKDSSGGRSGVRIGEVIESVDAEPVVSVESFREQIRQKRGAVRLALVQRGQVVVDP